MRNIVNETGVIFMARSGSERIKNKNLSLFGNPGEEKTLIEWKLEQLLQLFAAEKIIYSSDSEEYLEIGFKYGVTLHKRDKDLADKGSFSENLKTVAREAKTNFMLYSNGPCYPLIGPKRLRNFFSKLKTADLNKGAFGVEEIKGYSLYDSKWLNFEPGPNHIYSQNLKNPQKVVWHLTCRSTSKIIAEGSMFSDPIPTLVVPGWEAIDIDYPEDLIIAKAFIGKYNEFESD
jgi:CMP-N-acetylneuraminic acid synthetase